MIVGEKNENSRKREHIAKTNTLLKIQRPLKSKLDMGRVSLKAENNNRMKMQFLSGAGINFPQEQTENTCITKLQFRDKQHYLKHKIICMIEKKKKKFKHHK